MPGVPLTNWHGCILSGLDTTVRLHPMSVQAISYVLDFSQSEGGARHVLLSIANHVKADGTGAWPSVPTIAKESRLDQRTVFRALDELKKTGEIEIQSGCGPHGNNLYSMPKFMAMIQAQIKAGFVGPPTVELRIPKCNFCEAPNTENHWCEGWEKAKKELTENKK